MVFEAGLITFFRTILIIVLLYYFVKISLRYLLPFLLKLFLKKQEEKFNQSNSRRDTFSDRPKKTEKKVKKERLGDYVEYEEIED